MDATLELEELEVVTATETELELLLADDDLDEVVEDRD